MSIYELHRAMLYDTDATYALVYELEQSQFDLQAFSAGYTTDLQDPNMHYQLAQLDGQVVGLAGLYLQFHLHHANWVSEVQELMMMSRAQGSAIGSRLLAWAEATAHEMGAKITEFSTSTQRLNTHRSYQRENYTQSHLRFAKPL